MNNYLKNCLLALTLATAGLIGSFSGHLVAMEANSPNNQLIAACTICDVEQIKNALKRNALPDTLTQEGSRTPLHILCTTIDDNENTVEAINLLIDNNANINYLDGLSNTPLHTAIANCKLNCVRALIAKGADMIIENSANQNALALARDVRKSKNNTQSQSSTQLQNIEAIIALLKINEPKIAMTHNANSSSAALTSSETHQGLESLIHEQLSKEDKKPWSIYSFFQSARGQFRVFRKQICKTSWPVLGIAAALGAGLCGLITYALYFRK